MSELLAVLGLAALGSVVALIGGVVFLSSKTLSHSLAKYAAPFAAGVMITIALLGLLPEATHLVGDRAFYIALLAIFGAYAFETFFCDLHHHDHDGAAHDHEADENCKTCSVPLVLIGDTIHNFIDGVAIAASFLVNPTLGVVTAFSTFLHEVPHEIGDFGVLLSAGYSRKKVLLINAVSALSTLVGAAVVILLNPPAALIGSLLAVAAGMFIYLGASDFLPRAHTGIPASKALVVVLIGALLMAGSLRAVPHSHDHEADEHATEHYSEHDSEHHDDEMEENNDHANEYPDTHGHEELAE